MCEPDFLKCDGDPDCADKADELGCGEFIKRNLPAWIPTAVTNF